MSLKLSDFIGKKVLLKFMENHFPDFVSDKLIFTLVNEFDSEGNQYCLVTEAPNDHDNGQLVASGDLSGIQVNTVIIPAPGVGKRVEIFYSAHRSLNVNPSGVSVYSDNSGQLYGKVDFSKFSGLASPYFAHPIKLPENSPYLLSYDAAQDSFYFVQYRVVSVFS